MIPGFCTAYIDKDNYRHLYFFHGIDDDDKPIYNDIDLKDYEFGYDIQKNEDGSIDYTFEDRHIIKIICKLARPDGTKDTIVLRYTN